MAGSFRKLRIVMAYENEGADLLRSSALPSGLLSPLALADAGQQMCPDFPNGHLLPLELAYWARLYVCRTLAR
jgi:hypothetical protein